LSSLRGTRLQRLAISLDDDTAAAIDEHRKQRGYSNRSEPSMISCGRLLVYSVCDFDRRTLRSASTERSMNFGRNRRDLQEN